MTSKREGNHKGVKIGSITKDFARMMVDSFLLYSTAKPRSKVGKTKYKDEYEEELESVAKDFEREVESMKGDIYPDIVNVMGRYIDRFQGVQKKYLDLVEEKERRSGERFEKEVA